MCALSACDFGFHGDDEEDRLRATYAAVGEQGRGRFLYDDFLGVCRGEGCSLGNAILSGATATISYRLEDTQSEFALRSPQPEILSAELSRTECRCADGSKLRDSSPSRCSRRPDLICTGRLEITTKASGDAVLEILRPSNEVLERVTIRVRDAATLTVTDADKSTDLSVVKLSASHGWFEVRARGKDADGKALIADHYGPGVTWKVDDVGVAGFPRLFDATPSDSSTDHITTNLDAVSIGTTTLTLSGAGGAETKIPIQVSL